MNPVNVAPRVSVVIPTYNRLPVLIDAIESVLAQTYWDYELIVADDGSTDRTSAALEGYGDRIRYDVAPNRGASSARNRGAELARGEFIAFLDSDDLWEPDKLIKQIALFDATPNLGWVYCDKDHFGDEAAIARGNLFNRIPPKKGRIVASLLVAGCPMHTSGLVVRKSLFQAVGGFDETLRVYEDHDLYYKLSATAAVDYVDAPLAHCRRDNRPVVPTPAVLVESRATIKRKLFERYPEVRTELTQDEFRLGYLNALLDAAAAYWEEGDTRSANRLIAECRTEDPTWRKAQFYALAAWCPRVFTRLRAWRYRRQG